MKLMIRWLATSIAVAAAAALVPGIHAPRDTNTFLAMLVMAAVLGLVNALIRPVLQFLSCGLIILTLGLFTLVINAATLLIASSITQSLGIAFKVDGFWPAFWGAIVISIVSFLLSVFVTEEVLES